MDTKAMARAKMNNALNKIEMAQRLIGDACVEMSPIVGVGDLWTKCGKLYDQTHAFWHKVNLRRNGDGYDLDSDYKRALMAKVTGGRDESPRHS